MSFHVEGKHHKLTEHVSLSGYLFCFLGFASNLHIFYQTGKSLQVLFLDGLMKGCFLFNKTFLDGNHFVTLLPPGR